MKARYIRISSTTQSTARQLAKQHPDEKLFIDICSGSIPFNQRPQAKELLFAITMKQIDTVSVSSVDRLGRSSFNVQETIEHFNNHNITLHIDNLGISSIVNGKHNPIFKMITDVLANVASMEKEAIKERQAEGIAIAKAQGKFSGSRNKPSASDKDILQKYNNVAKQLKMNKYSLRAVSAITNVSLGTVQKVKAALERELKTN